MRVKETGRTIRVTGDVRLQGALHEPAEPVGAGVLVAHPHPLQGGDKENAVVRALTDACAHRGLLALRFDFRHARSRGSGDDLRTLFTDSERDLVAAAANLRAALPEGAPVALAGYSFGALVLLRTWRAVDATALAAVGVPVKGVLRDHVPWADLTRPERPPLLVLQGQYDEVGTPADVGALFSGHGVEADVRTIPNASHGYHGEGDLAGRMTAGFLAKRVGP